MKRVALFIGLLVTFSVAYSQTPKELYQTARGYLMQGDLDNAVVSYNTLLKVDPDNIDALNDYLFVLVLNKDYAKAIDLGKQLITKPKANEQSYQTFGMAYKGKAAYKDAEELYKEGLKKFPESGVLYNEFGELYAMQNKLSEAIVQWEAGIKADPANSNNYYNATMYYSKVNEDLFWAIQYGEIFVNIESYSPHTALIKVKLFDAYKKMFSGDQFDKLASNPANTPFQKAWYNNMSTATAAVKDGVNAETIGALRTRFILNWFYNKQNETTPFYLFEHQRYLMKEGMFDAYNQWIFGEVSSKDDYEMWVNTHTKELSFFKVYQQNKLYRQPTGEYYK